MCKATSRTCKLSHGRRVLRRETSFTPVGTVRAQDFEGIGTITTITAPNDIEITMEPVDDPNILSFFDIFKGGGFPIFSLSETGNLNVVGTISAQDLDLITVCDEPQQIVDTIFAHYQDRGFELSADEQEILLQL